MLPKPRKFPCVHCPEEFDDEADLRAHKARKAAEFDALSDPKPKKGEEVHLYCDGCDFDYKSLSGLVRHIRERHPRPQRIACPGCQAKFPSGGTMIAHIEQGRCRTITSKMLDQRRAEKAVFTRKLEQIKKAGEGLGVQKVPLDYIDRCLFKDDEPTRLPPEPPVGKAWTLEPGLSVDWASTLPSESETHREVSPRQLLQDFDSEFSTQDRQLATTTDDNAVEPHNYSTWAYLMDHDRAAASATSQLQVANKDLGPLRSQDPPQMPSQEAYSQSSLQRVEESSSLQTPREDRLVLHDPSHPSFDARKYWCRITEKYKCPHLGCYKRLDTPNGLALHLQSAAHGGVRAICPGCGRCFKSASALTQHAESNGQRCFMRYSDNYRVFFDQLTGGLADVVGMNRDGTLQYIVPENALESFHLTDEQKVEAANEQAFNEDAERKRTYWQGKKIKW